MVGGFGASAPSAGRSARLGLNSERQIDRLGKAADLGQIALACALGWIEFRQVFGDIRRARPKLYAWHDTFANRPSMTATVPST